MSEQNAVVEAWHKKANDLVTRINQIFGLRDRGDDKALRDEYVKKRLELDAHLRTPPEGMSLVQTAELATLRDQLATVTLERDALLRLLARSYSGVNLYQDDGEMSDSAAHPYIDFKRDPVSLIESKMQIRARAAIDAALQEKP